MSAGIAEGELLREARRLLRKLARPGARLVRDGAGFAVAPPGRPPLRGAPRAGAEIVAALRARDWLARDPSEEGAFLLSDAGLGWLRRTLAEHTPFAAQHQLRALRRARIADPNAAPLAVNEGESPLGWLRNRRGSDGKRMITSAQFEAGERLRRDFTLAQMTPRLTVDLSAPVLAGRRGAKAEAPLPEIVIAAKARVRAALRAAGPGLAELLVDVCCFLVGLEHAERQKGWPKQSARIVLGIALDRLALHYGFAHGPSRGRLRAWHAPEEKEARES